MTSDYMRDTSIPITVRQMKTTLFIVFLLLSANSMAEDQSIDSVLDEVDPFAKYDEPDPLETTGSSTPANKYDQFDVSANDMEFVVPPLSPAMKASRKKEKTITHYYNSIRPGAKLPDDVYECTLKNIRGIGSDVAATMVWQACLRLNLK